MIYCKHAWSDPSCVRPNRATNNETTKTNKHESNKYCPNEPRSGSFTFKIRN